LKNISDKKLRELSANHSLKVIDSKNEEINLEKDEFIVGI